MWTLAHARPDGTFVIIRPGGQRYHVLSSDPLFPAVSAAAEGQDLPPEPEPPPIIIPPRLPTPREFMDRLSPARQAEITAAAMGNAAVMLWLLRLLGATEVDPAHPETIAGVGALRSAGVITQPEAEALLA